MTTRSPIDGLNPSHDAYKAFCKDQTPAMQAALDRSDVVLNPAFKHTAASLAAVAHTVATMDTPDYSGFRNTSTMDADVARVVNCPVPLVRPSELVPWLPRLADTRPVDRNGVKLNLGRKVQAVDGGGNVVEGRIHDYDEHGSIILRLPNSSHSYGWQAYQLQCIGQ